MGTLAARLAAAQRDRLPRPDQDGEFLLTSPAMQQLVRYIVVPAVVGAVVGLVVMLVSQTEPPSTKPGYAEAVKRAAPAVVNIYSSKVVTPPICQLPRFREMYLCALS